MSPLTGTWQLVRLVLHRDRVRLPVWIISLVVLMAVSATQLNALYTTQADIDSYASTVTGNPALVMFAGPGYGFDHPTIGAILVNETSLWMAIACALMSVFLVNRHTRAEEESERADLLRSLVVGRHASLAAVLLVAVAANATVVLTCTAATLGFGYPVAGTLALCGSFGLVGVVFAGVMAITAQLASTGRGALGLGAAAVGLGFVVRGVGDVSTPVLSWLTPFGWGIGVRAYAGERWWTLVGLVLFAVTASAAAVALSLRRDLGSGLIPQRPGPATAPRWSTTPLGLTFRLQRTTVLAWSFGVFLTALVYGTVADDVTQMLEDNPALADYLAKIGGGTSLVDSYLGTTIGMMVMVVIGFAMSSSLRTRSDETAGFAESMLAAPLSRHRWLGAHLAVTVLGTFVVLLSTGLGLGIGYATAVHDASQMLHLVAAVLNQLPAVLVLVGVAYALFGWFPHASLVAWAGLAVVVIIGIFGDILRLPHWTRELSPLEHVPAMPAEPFALEPLLLLTAIAATLLAAGFVGFRRRDLTGA